MRENHTADLPGGHRSEADRRRRLPRPQVRENHTADLPGGHRSEADRRRRLPRPQVRDKADCGQSVSAAHLVHLPKFDLIIVTISRYVCMYTVQGLFTTNKINGRWCDNEHKKRTLLHCCRPDWDDMRSVAAADLTHNQIIVSRAVGQVPVSGHGNRSSLNSADYVTVHERPAKSEFARPLVTLSQLCLTL